MWARFEPWDIEIMRGAVVVAWRVEEGRTGRVGADAKAMMDVR